MTKEANEILNVRNLKTYFKNRSEEIAVIDDVSFSINKGEILGIIGESGSGKSVTSLSILQLLKRGKTRIDENSRIYFKGKDLLKMSNSEVRGLRGKEISMIFQDPMSSLNPVYTIRKQIAEVLTLHKEMKDKKKINEEIIRVLKLVGISSPEQRLKQYPHELSGGMRQRVMIAMALCCEPSLLIADEPTTALDVTIQAQILELLKDLRDRLGVSIILITHDMGVIADMADKVAVMYSGKIVEYGDIREIFYSPKHPYTKGLLISIPRIDKRIERLHSIEGVVPIPKERPTGCNFQNRCPYAMDICRQIEPSETVLGGERIVSCWLYDETIKTSEGS